MIFLAKWDYKDKRFNDEEWLKFHYVDLQWSANKIAKEIGYKSSSVTSKLKQIGIVLRNKYERVPRGDLHPNKSPKNRKKLHDSHLGFIMPEEQKQKISNTLSDPNITKWELLKIEFKNLFNNTCFICGINECNCKQNLQLHHINYKPHELYIKNNVYDIESERKQLVLLCSSCHSTVHHHTWEYYNLLSSYWANNNNINFNTHVVIKPISQITIKYDGTNLHTWTDKDWLYNMYIERSFSACTIAKICNCGVDIIYDWLKTYNISIRTHSDARKCRKNIKLNSF